MKCYKNFIYVVGTLWLTLSGAMFRLQLWPGHYAQLLKYYEGQPSVATQEIEKVIHTQNLLSHVQDLHRSFPEHPFYQSEEGLNCLRRVLTAYSWRNQGIGYCQSMVLTLSNYFDNDRILCVLYFYYG